MTFQLFSASGLFAFQICEFCVFASPESLHSEPSALPAHHCDCIYHFLCHRATPDYHQLCEEPISSVCFEAVFSDLCLIDFFFIFNWKRNRPDTLLVHFVHLLVLQTLFVFSKLFPPLSYRIF